MIDLRRILVPTDFSEHSKHALIYGVAFAEKFDAELYLLHVLQDLTVYQPDAVTMGPPAVPPLEELTASARLAFDRLIEENGLGRFKVRTEVREGSPVEEIVEFATENEVDLIVIATHGRGWLAQMLFGSVSEKVVRRAPCPVMAVHFPEHEFVKPG